MIMLTAVTYPQDLADIMLICVEFRLLVTSRRSAMGMVIDHAASIPNATELAGAGMFPRFIG